MGSGGGKGRRQKKKARGKPIDGMVGKGLCRVVSRRAVTCLGEPCIFSCVGFWTVTRQDRCRQDAGVVYVLSRVVGLDDGEEQQAGAGRQAGRSTAEFSGVVLQNGLEVLPALAPTGFGVESDDGDDH